MSARVKGILEELKSRLETTSYAVHIGKEFTDEKVDSLPMVSVFFAQKGEASQEDDMNRIATGLQKQALNLAVECHARVDPDNPILDLEDVHTAVKDAIFDPAGKQIADGQMVLLKRRRSWPHSKYSDIAFFQIELKIPFREEY